MDKKDKKLMRKADVRFVIILPIVVALVIMIFAIVCAGC